MARAKKVADHADLAVKMVEVVVAARGGPMLTVRRLADLVGARPGDAAFKMALQDGAFTGRVFVAAPKAKSKAGFLPDALVCAVQDIAQLARDEAVLAYAMRLVCTPKTTAQKITDLAGALTGARKGELVSAFKENLQQRVADGTLPAWLGYVLVRGKEYLFRRDDIFPRDDATITPTAMPEKTPTSPPVSAQPMGPATPPPTFNPVNQPDGEFARCFESAFNQLDRADGNRNFVKLLAMRQALPQFDRATFDAGLNELRRAGIFTLDAADGGVVTLSPEERAAGLIELGALLAYVSRR